jgi:hypothetical protein
VQTIKFYRAKEDDSFLLLYQGEECYTLIKRKERESMAKGDISAIIFKLKNIWTLRQTVSITRFEFQNPQHLKVQVLQVQVGSVNRGILLIADEEDVFLEETISTRLSSHWETDEMSAILHVIMQILLNK